MDGWYYRFFDADFGPVSFDELVELVKSNSFSREDQVRYGNSGPWRQAGSIGPLMAHFPFQAAQHVVSQDSQREFEARKLARESAVTKPQTPTSVQVFELPQGAVSQLLPTPVGSATKSGLAWWCLIQDKEYGPIEYAKVLEWVEAGRIHPEDHLRCGRDAYRLAGTVAGLFPERPASAANTDEDISSVLRTRPLPVAQPKSGETRRRKISEAAIDAWLSTEMPAFPKSAFTADTYRQTPAPSISAASVNPAKDGNNPELAINTGFGRGPNPRFADGGFGGGTTSFNRPMPVIRRPANSRKDATSIVEMLTSPTGIKVGSAILAVVIVVFALPYVSLRDSANVKHFKKLRDAVNEVTFLRNDDNIRPEQFKPLQSNLEHVANSVLNEVKDGNATGQRRLKNLAQKVQEMAKADLAKPSDAEKVVNTQLLVTAKELKVSY